MIRSLLFIPGNSPAMLAGADIHGADAVIFDLEDAVPPGEKDAARILLTQALRFLPFEGLRVMVRVNPLDTPFARADYEAVIPLKPAMIMPPKLSSAEEAREISSMVGALERLHGIVEGSIGLLPLIETAVGLEAAGSIAGADTRISALLLGAEDLAADLNALRTKEGGEILYARGRILSAAKAAGIDVYDTPFTDVNDEEGVRKDATLARGMGFSGKAVISPRHVDIINSVFAPTPEEIAFAREVLAALEEGSRLGRGAVSLRGKMIDKPVADRARRVLLEAAAIGMEVNGHE